MSVFKGSITEYPGVIVDHFTPFNCKRGRAFFLSHCHKDHMTGLNSPQIVDSLQRRNSSLYCSEVTRSLLLQDPDFTQLAPYLRGLPMDEPVPMSLEAYTDSAALNFTVTLLPAGHCPGSSMFFYQGSNGSVLYTGDFRLTLEETKRLQSLHCAGRLLEIKSLYLDTTFCHPIATTIPSRDVSRRHIIKIVESWLSKNERSVVHLQLGMFGYEHIYMGLAKRFDTKVHIARWKLNAYRDLPAVADCLTTDGESTRIHACRFRKGVHWSVGLPCGSRCQNKQPPPVLGIKPSTLWFLSNSGSLTEPYKYLPGYNVYRVLHSMHASYSELCDFINYLKPTRITPCVIPLGDRSLADVNIRLKTLLPQVEVVIDTTNSSSTSNQLNAQSSKTKKPKPEKHKSDRASDFDNCSNDTIDEFASSEERDTPNQTFSELDKSILKPFTLPTMFSDCAMRSVVLDESKPDCVLESLGSSSNATLGSLEQTPIDLSPDITPPESASLSAQTHACGELDETITESCFKLDVPSAHAHYIRCESPTEVYFTKTESPIRNNHVNLKILEVEANDKSADFSVEKRCDDSKGTVLYTAGQTPKEEEEDMKSALHLQAEGKECISTSQCSSTDQDDWHLTLESSIEEERPSTSDSDVTEGETGTPKPKRIKVTNVNHRNEPESLSTPVLNTDHQDKSLSVEIIEHRVIEYIDLTQDHQSLDSTNTYEVSPVGPSNLTDTINDIEINGSPHSSNRTIKEAALRPTKAITLPKEHQGDCQPDLSHEHSPSELKTGVQETSTEHHVECSPSNSRHSRSLSPLCLPPTPGREGVDSILERKNIAF